MQDWQEKIREGMELMKEGCQATICCSICPFTKYCHRGGGMAPVSWKTPENQDYKITVSYDILVSDAADKEEATQRALDHFRKIPSPPDRIEIKTTK